MSTIVSGEDPPFPLLREVICVYLLLTECYGQGVAQIRVSYVDGEHEEPRFGTSLRALDFSGRSPLELLGITFRIEAWPFPQAGQYAVQFWYDNQKVAEHPLRLR